MNAFLNDVAETYFRGHIDQYGGPDSTFIRFEIIENSTTNWNLIFNTFVGRIVYKLKGMIQGSRLIQVKYYDSEVYARCWGILVPWMKTELWFCQTVLPAIRWMGRVHVHDVIPKLYAFQHQTLDPTSATKCAILWENLDGFKVCSSATLLDYEHLSMMAQKIAQFHAFSFGVRVKRPQFFTREVPNFTTYSVSRPIVEILKRCLQPLLQVITIAANTEYAEAVGRLQTMLAEFESRINRPFAHAANNVCRLVCHQHYTQLNAAFKHEPGLQKLTDMRIVNWQWLGFASLGVDLVYLLAVEGGDRTQFFGPLLNDYTLALNNSIAVTTISAPSREQILDEIKMSMPLALHILGKRVLGSSQKQPSGESTYPPIFWNDQRITDTYKFMIELNLV